MDRTAGILISQSARRTQVSEGQAADIYTVRLASAPSSPVTITINTDNQTLVTKQDHAFKKLVKIMPIGDSITYGVIDSNSNTESGGYRTYLWDMLTADKDKFDFVGSQSNGPNSIDRDHEGYRGQKIRNIANSTLDRISKTQPDVVLLLAGSNDINQDSDLANAPKRLSEFVDQIIKAAPNVTVLVGTLPPSTKSANNPAQIQAFNTAIRGIFEQKANHKKVKLVDLYSHLSNQDLSDQIHLTAKGYKKMAQAWYETLTGVLNSPDFMTLSNTRTLTFTPRNWNIPQTITVAATNDGRAEKTEASTILHRAISDDSNYNNLAVPLVVSVADDDPGVTIIPLNNNHTVKESGAEDVCSVVLTSRPIQKVVVNLSTDDQLNLSRSKFTFTSKNWNRPQTLKVTAVDDADIEGSHTGTITETIRSLDPQYRSLAAGKTVFDITDNDSVSDAIDTTLAVKATAVGEITNDPLMSSGLAAQSVLQSSSRQIQQKSFNGFTDWSNDSSLGLQSKTNQLIDLSQMARTDFALGASRSSSPMETNYLF